MKHVSILCLGLNLTACEDPSETQTRTAGLHRFTSDRTGFDIYSFWYDTVPPR